MRTDIDSGWNVQDLPSLVSSSVLGRVSSARAVLFSAQTTSSLPAADVVVTGDIVIKRRVSAQPDADRHRSVVGLSAARVCVCVCLHHLSFIST